MKDEKDLKKVNAEQPETTGNGEEQDVEGYEYCETHKQRCSNDCFGTPVLSHLN